MIFKRKSWIHYLGDDLFSANRTGAFINGYISDINSPWLDNNLFLVFDSNQHLKINFKLLESEDEFLYKKNIRVNGNFYTVFVYGIPFENNRDLSMIKDGLYSKVSDKLKSGISSVWSLSENNSLYKAIHITGKELFSAIENESIYEEDYTAGLEEGDWYE